MPLYGVNARPLAQTLCYSELFYAVCLLVPKTS